MAVELRPGVWHFRLRGTNAYLVEDRGALALVDAGMPWQAGAIRRQLEVAGVSMRDVDRVLVTHYDLDHVGGLRSLLADADADRADADGIEVHCGERDADLLAGRRKPPLSVPKGVFQRVTGLLAPSVETRVRPVTDGDEVGGFEAIHAPGHTPGHTVYVHEDLETAILGDLVRESDGALEPSPWFLSSDTDEAARSVRRVLDRAPDFEVACVGHGSPLRSGGRRALERLGDRLDAE